MDFGSQPVDADITPTIVTPATLNPDGSVATPALWEITCPAPAAPVGTTANLTVDVTVTTPAGTSGPPLLEMVAGSPPPVDPDAYTYLAPPTVSSITYQPPGGSSTAMSPTSPGWAPLGGGTVLAFIGTNLENVSWFDFGGTPGINLDHVSDSKITVKSPPVAGDMTVDVQLHGGGGNLDTGDQFYFEGTPVVTNVSPNQVGCLEGITTVTITGWGLYPATDVDFANEASPPVGCPPGPFAAQSPFSGNTPTQVVVTYPGDDEYTNPDYYEYAAVTTPQGTSPVPAHPVLGADAYVLPVQVPITITGLSTSSGPATGGTTVIITGTNLKGVYEVLFGSEPVSFTPYGDPSGGPITVVSPQGGAGTTSLEVVAGDAETASAPWTYTPSAFITGVTPGSALISGGQTLTVTGTDLGVALGFPPNEADIFLTGAASAILAPILQNGTESPTEFQISVPAVPLSDAGEYADIQVFTALGWTPICAADEFKYTVPAGLGVSGVSPSTGPVAGGTQVVISGSYLDQNWSCQDVDFGGIPATSVTPVSATTVLATSPASPGNATGPVDVTVDTIYGWTPVAPATDQFTYYVPTPIVTGLSPAACPITPAGGPAVQVPVTISGSNLVYVTQVDFGNSLPPVTVTAADENPDGSITVLCPPDSTAGAMDVTVQSPGGTSATSPADQFAYGPMPVISAIVSNIGPAWLGSEIQILGENLSGVTEVDFDSGANTYQGTDINSSQATIIYVYAPYCPPGTMHVRVWSSIGLESADDPPADLYTFTLAPIVTGVTVSPSAGNPYGYTYGPGSGGTTVTISGYNLMQNLDTGATAVDFGGVPAASFTNNWASPPTITAVTPAGSGNVSVSVTTAQGTASGGSFTYFGTPSVTSITPAAGPLGGGNFVLISGGNLVDNTVDGGIFPYLLDTTVDFGSVAATGAYALNGSLCVAAPEGIALGTVDVTVTNVGGTSAISQPADQYTYMPPPVVSGLSLPSGAAASGAVEGGTPVVITGTLLAGATAVDFGSQAATIISDADDEMAVVSPASATGVGPVDVTVTSPDGTSAISEPADLFTYTHAPFISQVTGPLTINGTQAAGLTTGGNTVTISGDDLTGASAVNFGSTVVPQFSVDPKGHQTTNFTVSPDGTTITVTDPAGTAGMVDITVTTPLGTSDVKPADEFTYVPMPIVTGISPSSGSSLGGTQVTITGTGLANASYVFFGPDELAYAYTGNCGTIVSDTDTQIVVTSPAENAFPSTVDVTVMTAWATSATVPADQFTWVPPPSITSQTASAGPVWGGTTMSLYGTNLAGATVTFGGNPATVQGNSDTCILVSSPEATGDTPGWVSLTVTTAYGATSVNFTYAPPPVVSAISTSSGPVAGGTTVDIFGSGLAGTTAVDFGSVSVAFAELGVGYTYLQVVSPAGTPSTVDITVTTAGGTSDTSPADQFTYVAVPSVSGISPPMGFMAAGTPVTVYGTGLANATAVEFGGVPATNLSYTTDGEIVVNAPQAYPYYNGSTVDVTVTTAGGTSATSPADQFTYYMAPSVTGLSPSSGLRTGDTLVTISMAYCFNSVTAVDFGQNAGTIVSQSFYQIQVESPAGTAGTADVTLLAPGGSVSAGQFTYLPLVPAVSGVSPAVGAAAGGTQVTIAGTDLEGATAVDFGSTAASSFTIDSPTQITATDAAGTVGTVDVTVTTPAGTSSTSPADQFTGITAPVVTAVSASAGATAGGSDVAIYGTDLGGATAVNFGAAGATVLIDTDTYILAATPAGAAGTVYLTVTTPYGTSATSPGYQFTYVGPPSAVADCYTMTLPTAAGGSSLAISAPGVLGNDTGLQGYLGLKASLVTGPADGTLAFNSNGSFTYTPNPGYFGTDTFTYQAIDPYGNSAPTTVSMTVGPATMTWIGGSGGTGGFGTTGNWTDNRWFGACLSCPDNTVSAVVNVANVVNVPSNQAAYSLAISQGGQVAIGPDAVLSVTSSTSVTGGSTLSVDPDGALFSGGTVTVDTGGTLSGGPIVAAAYQLNSGTVSADLYGAGGVTKDTAGTVLLTGANGYAGPTLVKAGTLIAGNASALPQGTNLTIGAGGVFIFDPSQGGGPAAGLAASAAASVTSTPMVAASAAADAPLAASVVSTLSPAIPATSAAVTTVYDALQQVSAVAAPSAMLLRTDAAAKPASVSNVASDAVFASHRAALDPTVAPAENRQAARPWAWLAAMESSASSADPCQATESKVAALDKVLARFGV